MNVNKIYDTIEAKLTELTGSRPNATERLEADLGCDSLYMVDIMAKVEEEHNVDLSEKLTYREIPQDATVLDLAILLTDKINEK